MWGRSEPEAVEFLAVQPPGRGSRLGEPAPASLPEMIHPALRAIRPYLDRPFALFGHSMGAWAAFEMARRLEEEGPSAPTHLFVSGRRAPHLPPAEAPVSHLADEPFLREVSRRYGGIPDPILREPELLKLFLPTMRADICALEKYRFIPGPPLRCAVQAFGGSSDGRVPLQDLEAWSQHTQNEFRCRRFSGGHFYLEEERAALLREIVAILESHDQEASSGSVPVGRGLSS